MHGVRTWSVSIMRWNGIRQYDEADIALPLDKLLGFAQRQVERLRFLVDCREVAAEDYDYAMGQCHQIGEMLRAQGRKML